MPLGFRRPARAPQHFSIAKTLLLALALFIPGSRAAAQTRHRPSLDFTIGPATSWGGAHDYTGRAGGSWTLTFVPDNRGSRVVAFTIGARSAGEKILLCRPDPLDGCRPDFPDMTDLGIGVGLKAGAPAARARAILGPMLYLGDFRAGGARLQVDVAGGFQHVQLVVSGRGDLVRRGAENLRLGSLEVGLRLID